jgi:rubredoxin
MNISPLFPLTRAMAEAAYRATVQKGGKNQKSLTVGWEVLGLDEETAKRIFEEEAEEGFMSYRETMYGGQTTKYDKHGNVLDDKGKLVDPESAEGGDDDDEEDGSSAGMIQECGNCGYTMFVAKGRDFKFFGDDFKCPECGAAKDQFKSRTIEEE